MGKAVLKLQLDKLTDGAKDVNALFRTAIESQPAREQKLLAACAVCVQEGFWLPLTAQIAQLSEDDADESANALVRGSLLRVLDRDRRRFQLHALLREQLRARAGTDGLARLQERHAAALEGLFKDRETRWRDCRECLDEINPATAFLWERREFAREPYLTYSGYELARRVGEYNAAFRVAQHEESLWSRGEDQSSRTWTHRSYRYQAIILYLWGRLQDAFDLYRKIAAICEDLGDKDGLQQTYGNQALILQAWGRLEEALMLHKKQEAICQELGNKDGLSKSYSGQGLVLHSLGQADEALAMYNKEEALCVELGDKDGLQRSYGNQANIYYAWGRLDEALALHKKQEAICLELGNKGGLQASYGNQASILRDRGKLEEALELYKKKEAL